MKSFKEFLAEAKYEVEVSVRDAKKANDIASDMFRGEYKMDGSNSFIFKKKDAMEDFISELESQKIEILEEAKYKKEVGASKLKVGDVILYGPEDTPHAVTGKPKQDGTGYWVPVKNQATNKTDRIYIDSGDTVPMNESNNAKVLKINSGSSTEYLAFSIDPDSITVRVNREMVVVDKADFEKVKAFLKKNL